MYKYIEAHKKIIENLIFRKTDTIVIFILDNIIANSVSSYKPLRGIFIV